MKKILLFNYGYYPAQKFGGPVNSVANFCTLMKDECECYLITCDHDMGTNERLAGIHESWNQVGDCKVLYVPDKKITYSFIKNIIEELSPNVVYLQSVFEAKFVLPVLFATHNNKAIRKIIAPRGDICEGAMKKKKLLKKLYLFFLRHSGLNKNIIVHSTLKEETENAKRYLRVDEKFIYEIENTPSLSLPTMGYYKKEQGVLSIVYIGRIVPKKNLLSAIKYVAKIENGMYFDIYGTLENEEYWEECLKAIPPEMVDRITYKGQLQHDQVYKVFNEHDVFLFPTVSENYGHTIVESMQSGCPVIISDRTPWRNLSSVKAGWDVPLGDDDGFCSVLLKLRDMDEEEYSEYKKGTKEYIEKHVDFSNLREEYKRLISDGI